MFISILLSLWTLAEPTHAFHLNCVTGDFKLGHRFTPNCKGIDQNLDGSQIQFTHNREGLRDIDYPPKYPKSIYRILFVGASQTVNFNDKEGIVPGIRSEISRLFQKSPLRKRYKKIEMIAGGEAGYNIVQTYLRLPELLAAYNPKLVVFFDSYVGFAEDSAFFHLSSEEYNENGLVKNHGNYNQLYPFPFSWHEYIWNHLWGQEVRGISIGLRKAFQNYKINFGIENRCPKEKGLGCISGIYANYLDEMQRLSKEAKADFILLKVSMPLDWSPPEAIKEKEKKYADKIKKANNYLDLRNTRIVSKLIQPFTLPSNQECRSYVKFIDQSYDPIDVYGISQERFYQSLDRHPEEYHLDELASTELGKDIAPLLFKKILSLKK